MYSINYLRMKKLFTLFLLSTIISCKKDKSNDNDCNWKCNDVLAYDSLQIINNLIEGTEIEVNEANLKVLINSY